MPAGNNNEDAVDGPPSIRTLTTTSAVTRPRRVGAIFTADRLSAALLSCYRNKWSYQISDA